jgi:hypothetical protein
MSLSIIAPIGFMAACMGIGSRPWPCPGMISGILASAECLVFVGEADTCFRSLWCFALPLLGWREGLRVRLLRSSVWGFDGLFTVASFVLVLPHLPSVGAAIVWASIMGMGMAVELVPSFVRALPSSLGGLMGASVFAVVRFEGHLTGCCTSGLWVLVAVVLVRFVDVGMQVGWHIFRYVAGALAIPCVVPVPGVWVDCLVVVVSILGLRWVLGVYRVGDPLKKYLLPLQFRLHFVRLQFLHLRLCCLARLGRQCRPYPRCG